MSKQSQEYCGSTSNQVKALHTNLFLLLLKERDFKSFYIIPQE